MPQAPKYARRKDFAQEAGDRTDHVALNAELDDAALSINCLRANLALIQRDDGGLRDGLVDETTLTPLFKTDLKRELYRDIRPSVAASQQAAQQAQAAEQGAQVAEQKSTQAAHTATEKATQANEHAHAAEASARTAHWDATDIRHRLKDIKKLRTPADNTVSEPKLMDEAVTTRKLAPQAVTEEKLAFGGVTEEKLAPGAVTTAKMAPQAVTANQLAPEAVTSAKLADGAIEQKLGYTPADVAKTWTIDNFDPYHLHLRGDQIIQSEDGKTGKHFRCQDDNFEILNGRRTAVIFRVQNDGVVSNNGWLQLNNPNDGSTRALHHNDGTIGFVGHDRAWKLRVQEDGNVWTPMFGWLSESLARKANAGANCQHNAPVYEFGQTPFPGSYYAPFNMPNPYVWMGWRAPVNSTGAIHPHGMILRNQ